MREKLFHVVREEGWIGVYSTLNKMFRPNKE